ncbi:hypothetical protein [Amycolatopsis regifaucium]|uniref:Lipoprotein n=1 Tax=Amycolatopsis regifaucium TaxID=546365 RepID=A0A154MS73_9PSEU|nr:hypothetical protein [Amycolatopsis regifaucium]KZB87136.1 hypothetical protein AVL48_20895 [Amycolatopsis regifaucium]OKA07967.1 hypothetical protein ATP06_0211660 [Amycolatopsis regifaucium]SFJ74073.1 hypothetical protein SAMN04489731_1364 [Amycolatopsis regifaucium]
MPNHSRRFVLTVGLAGLAASACGASPQSPGLVVRATPAPVEPAVAAPPVDPLATNLLVGFCGAPGSKALGRMTGDLSAASLELQKQIKTFPAGRPITPVVELIATTVHRSPGADGMYRSRCADKTIREYLDAARAMNGLLLLDIQPGRADFLPEVRAYEHWLKEPDVGVALDPEWAVEPGAIPGKKFGRTTGAELDEVAAYLGELAERHRLPAKVMVYHQVTSSVVRDEELLRPHPGVSVVKVVDGIGSGSAKKATWKTLMPSKPAHVRPGFKLFFDEDTRRDAALMTPEEVLALTPTPAYVIYE